MKLICKFVVNTQNAIRSCLLALSFDPTTFIEIAVYIQYTTLQALCFKIISCINKGCEDDDDDNDDIDD